MRGTSGKGILILFDIVFCSMEITRTPKRIGIVIIVLACLFIFFIAIIYIINPRARFSDILLVFGTALFLFFVFLGPLVFEFIFSKGKGLLFGGIAMVTLLILLGLAGSVGASQEE